VSAAPEPPKYYAITRHLTALVADLAEGDPVPTERDLAARFGVSRVTARQAVQDLVVAGRLRRQGRGTVVAGPKLTQPLALGSYTDGLRRMGLRPGRELVGLDTDAADPDTAAALGVAAAAPVIRLERILLADDEPVGLEETRMSADRFPDLVRDFDPTTSLYAYYERVGTAFSRATEQIETVLADPREAGLLDVNPATPMLLLHRTSYDVAECPVERVRSLFRGDRVSFTSDLRA
jgi:GntR family transcriptional regulator